MLLLLLPTARLNKATTNTGHSRDLTVRPEPGMPE
jgi:hypothetical protein